jgi:hypothetical protein
MSDQYIKIAFDKAGTLWQLIVEGRAVAYVDDDGNEVSRQSPINDAGSIVRVGDAAQGRGEVGADVAYDKTPVADAPQAVIDACKRYAYDWRIDGDRRVKGRRSTDG